MTAMSILRLSVFPDVQGESVSYVLRDALAGSLDDLQMGKRKLIIVIQMF